MMNLDQLRETIMPVLAPYVSEVALFGSVARGQETDQYDLPLLKPQIERLIAELDEGS